MVHQGDLIGPEGSTFDLLQGEAHHSLRGQLRQQRQARAAVAAKRSSRQKGAPGENRKRHKNGSWVKVFCLFLYQFFVMFVSCVSDFGSSWTEKKTKFSA